MTQDARDALGRLWSTAVFIVTLAALFSGAWVYDAILRDGSGPPMSAPMSGMWGVLWTTVLVGITGYQLRRNVWQPYWMIATLGYSDAEKRVLLSCVAQTAIGPALGLAVLAAPLMADQEGPWIWALLIPAFYFWDWLSDRRIQFVDLAIGRAGFLP